MIHLVWPWVLFFLPLPLIIRWLVPAADDHREAPLLVPFAEDFLTAGETGLADGNRSALLWLAAATWILLVFAATRPQWLGEPVELPVSGRDLLMAFDISGSMQAEDFEREGRRVTRLGATKAIGSEFIKRRTGDRIGLLLFGDQAYVQVPLTFDRETVLVLLDEAVVGLAGKQTAIGDAIGLGIKRLQDRPAENRVLILLTDGANTAGTIEPLKAAELGKRAGVTIYTIGIGADTMVVQSLFGPRRVNPSSDLDEKTLKDIATTTGGQYFRARDSKELESIYSIIDRLEPVVADSRYYRPHQPLFYWSLGISLLLAALLLLLWRKR